MKIGKQYIGRLVRLSWNDPCGGGRHEIKAAPKGIAALAYWNEYGIIDDISDGVVRIRHSECFNYRGTEPDEASYSWVPEDLIDSIKAATFDEERGE